MTFITGGGDVLLTLLVAAGGIFLTLLTAFLTAYIFGYGFTFGTVAAKAKIASKKVHRFEDSVERPFKTVAHDIHHEEETTKDHLEK